MIEIKLTRDSKFSDYLALLKEKLACTKALIWGEEQLTRLTTFGEALDEFLHDETKPQSWAAWLMVTLSPYLDESVREEIIQKITDPMTAFKIYTKIKDLSDAEDRALEKIFKDKLKRAEQELREGIIIREKDK